MTGFLQLHLLTFYPPANLNRDDTGRPKTATVGGVPRLRISSQALKRAWRTSAVFAERLHEFRGKRTQRFGENIENRLQDKGVEPKRALQIARDIAQHFGTLKPESDRAPARTEQLAFISPEEQTAALALADRIAAGEAIEPSVEKLLRRTDTAADIAMFGRMLAENPAYNREAAVQVAHAITTHRVTVEDDYYTAIDDLKTPEEDAGAGFISELGFGSGIFYLYACVDTGLLVKNLGGERGLAADACAALAEAAATVSPKGKQPSFAARARAHYVLAEFGSPQPRTLAGAFIKPVDDADLATASVKELEEWRSKLDRAYGPAAEASVTMDVAAERGTLADIVEFCRDAAAGHA
jgi:CRISPR system Cascade subunit CasC